MTSIPSVNFTPRISFGNWLCPSISRTSSTCGLSTSPGHQRVGLRCFGLGVRQPRKRLWHARCREHCQFIDSQDQADAFNARLRAHVVRSFAQGGNIDIAIVGGGATGVELAAELSRMVELAAGYGEAEIRRRLRLTCWNPRRASSAHSRRRSPTWPHPSCDR